MYIDRPSKSAADFSPKLQYVDTERQQQTPWIQAEHQQATKYNQAPPRRCSNLSVVLLEDPVDDALPALLDPRRLHAHVLERHRLLRPAHRTDQQKQINRSSDHSRSAME